MQNPGDYFIDVNFSQVNKTTPISKKSRIQFNSSDLEDFKLPDEYETASVEEPEVIKRKGPLRSRTSKGSALLMNDSSSDFLKLNEEEPEIVKREKDLRLDIEPGVSRKSKRSGVFMNLSEKSDISQMFGSGEDVPQFSSCVEEPEVIKRKQDKRTDLESRASRKTKRSGMFMDVSEEKDLSQIAESVTLSVIFL